VSRLFANRGPTARFPLKVLDTAESEQFKNAAIERDLIYDRRMWLWDYRLRSKLMVAEGVNLFEAKKRVRLKSPLSTRVFTFFTPRLLR
jgi:hypothetical protein